MNAPDDRYPGLLVPRIPHLGPEDAVFGRDFLPLDSVVLLVRVPCTVIGAGPDAMAPRCSHPLTQWVGSFPAISWWAAYCPEWDRAYVALW